MKDIVWCSYCGERKVYAKGLCRSCYMRLRRNGTLDPVPRKKRQHQEGDKKVEAWLECGRNCTKAAKKANCTRQAIWGAVHRYYKPTNADRIRSMTDEELADFLGSIVHDWGEGGATIQGKNCTYVDDWLDWLRKEEGV